MPTLEFDLHCSKCHTALICRWATVGSLPTMYVEPCKSCLEQARELGIQEAKEEATDE